MLRIFRFRDIWGKCQSARTYTQKMSGEVDANLKQAMEKVRVKPLGQAPKVWQLIEKMSNDGKKMKFTIQEIPEDRHEDALQHMCKYFLADEPTCECLNAKDDPDFVQDISAIWRQLFKENISIAAFTENPNGGKPIIAGMNALGIDIKDHKSSISDFQFKSQKCRNTFEVIAAATKVVYEHYGIKKYLYAIGLSVDPDYRGYGLGKDLLKIRNQIGREYNIPATATAFTSIISQKSAAGAGLELFFSKEFVDMVDENRKQYFPGIKSKTFKVMGKRLP